MSPSQVRIAQHERRARTRARLLKAAGTVFAEHGYHGATLENVLAEAGVSRGALYHYFRSKHELFLALLNERMITSVEKAAVHVDNRATGDEQLTDAANEFLDRIQRNPRWLPLLLEFLAIGCRDADVRTGVVDSFMRPAREQAAALISRAHAEPRSGGLTIDELAIGVTALINGLAIERAFDPDVVPVDLPGRLLATLADGAA